MADPAYFFSGSLFSSDYLVEAIRGEAAYASIDAAGLAARLKDLFAALPTSPNEAHTEDHLIWPTLRALGWTRSLRQQNLSAAGREDVPDGILFSDSEALAAANSRSTEKDRYEHGLTVVESKRLGRPLDRAAGRDEVAAPSTQMLRYLTRARSR